MQEIDGTGIDFAEHALRHQLVQIMAGGIALHIKTLRQIARGKHLTDIFRIKKNPFGSSGKQAGHLCASYPLTIITSAIMMPRNKALLPCVLSLYSFFCGSPHTFTQRWISARYQKREEEAAHGLAYESRCTMRLMLV
ncbi:Uncharacterised protein [Salmonella enterica subsp. enterica]|uniref:Uncharacterized protein n=1 Tax=Salmonella enterica I TaxID=59201 RepID=A0A447TNE4_SALET|nr:Uncharacterised protein [Salmonella enterica subsp. enterica]